MLSLKKILPVVLSFTFITIVNNSEAQNFTLPEVIHPSPTATAMARYGFYQVSKYTGTVDVSLPIHEMILDGKTLPINLSYVTSGIRVSQDASWVGLGWSLSANAVVTREIKGRDDFHVYGYVNQPSLPQPSFTEEERQAFFDYLGAGLDEIDISIPQ